MIRKLREEDRNQILNYLYQDSSFNIFIIGDIEAFGFDKDWQTVYAEFDDKNNVISTLLFYRDNAVYYSHQERYNLEYNDILKNYHVSVLNGKESLIDLILPYLPNYTKKPMYFCEVKDFQHNQNHNETIKQLQTKEEAGRLYEMLSQISEFSSDRDTKEQFISNKMASLDTGLTLYLEKNSEIVASVTATAETTVNAMVVAVATAINHRKEGYASLLMQELLNEYINNRSKGLCLFYDNPDAGSIYKRLGFKDIGKWTMAQKNS